MRTSISKLELESFLTSEQVSRLEMDQLDCHDHLWSWVHMPVYGEGDLRASLTPKEGEASPKGAGR